jgi:nitric oxide reductase activation protein
MKDFDQQKKEIKQYLLGDLNEERQQLVEERLMSQSNYRDEVLMVESELVEDYITETLLPAERSNFEKHYLSAPRQQKNLKLTKALLKTAQSTRPVPAAKTNLFKKLSNFFQARSPRLRFATASLILLVLLGAGVTFYAWRLRLEKSELTE